MFELICNPVDDIRSPRWYWQLKLVQGEGIIAEGEEDGLTACKTQASLAVERHKWVMKTHEHVFKFVDNAWVEE